MIFLKSTVFVRTFIKICSDDNKCMDDDDKHVMIANLHNLYDILSTIDSPLYRFLDG